MKFIELAERVYGPDHPNCAAYLHNASVLYCRLKEFDRARDLTLKAYSIRVKCFGPDHPETKNLFEFLKIIPS